MIPDPVEFVADALERGGALLERRGDRATALLPAALAKRLGVAEDVELALFPDGPRDVGCGLGAPLLEQLVAAERSTSPLAAVRLEVEPPRPAHVRAVVPRLVLRNGVADEAQVSMGTAVYAAASVSYVVEADERREGLVRVLVHEDGGEPDAAALALADLTWPSDRVRAASLSPPGTGAARWIVARAERAVRKAVVPAQQDVNRRYVRDYDRIVTYFAELVAAARAPRRRVEAAAIEAKVAHLIAERDAKVRELRERFALRVSSSLTAVVLVEVPVAFAAVLLRRRKMEREVLLRVPSGAYTPDKLPCEGCGEATLRPAACDARMHLLCEVCAPSAQGRIACAACRAGQGNG